MTLELQMETISTTKRSTIFTLIINVTNAQQPSPKGSLGLKNNGSPLMVNHMTDHERTQSLVIILKFVEEWNCCW